MPEASLVFIQISAPAIVRRSAFGAKPGKRWRSSSPS